MSRAGRPPCTPQVQRRHDKRGNSVRFLHAEPAEPELSKCGQAPALSRVVRLRRREGTPAGIEQATLPGWPSIQASSGSYDRGASPPIFNYSQPLGSAVDKLDE